MVCVVIGTLQHVVGGNVRRMREAGGHSQESFAELIGYHRTWVGAVERGERNLTMKTLEQLAQRLQVHPFDLLWDREGSGVRLHGGGTIRAEGLVAVVDDDPGPLDSRSAPTRRLGSG